MQDVVLDEEPPAGPAAAEPAEIDPTIPTIELLDADVAVVPSLAEPGPVPLDPDADLSMSMPSFALSVDDTLVVGPDNEPSGRGRDAGLAPTDVGLPDLAVPTLDDTALTFTDEDVPGAPPGAEPFALPDFEATEAPGHLTLEMKTPDLPDHLVSSLFEEHEPALPLDASAPPGAPGGAGPEKDFTSSDAIALGNLDDFALPGHLTLELDALEVLPDVPSVPRDDRQRGTSPGDAPPRTSPPQQQADDEEELILDLDDLDLDDDTRKDDKRT
jgi:hypothetical protein